jgi:hypothetical protein
MRLTVGKGVALVGAGFALGCVVPIILVVIWLVGAAMDLLPI